MEVVAASSAGALAHSGGPGRGVARVVGKAGNGQAQPLVTGRAERDRVARAGGLGDRSDPGLGGEVLLADEAGAVVAELGRIWAALT